MGSFTCTLYKDLTPPGASDEDVIARCVAGARGFQFQYAV